ncbi:hypothetical protein B0H19DRAFT_1085963 [Mycena capillaripes]|nr:hypothetical protein B0H19DRAFT_1085963 [Mycena capillaripes]
MRLSRLVQTDTAADAEEAKDAAAIERKRSRRGGGVRKTEEAMKNAETPPHHRLKPEKADHEKEVAHLTKLAAQERDDASPQKLDITSPKLGESNFTCAHQEGLF